MMVPVFENPEIAPDALPAADAVDWQALAPRYIRRLQVQAAMTATAIFAGLMAVEILSFPLEDLISPTLAVLVPAVILLHGLVWPAVSVPKKGYAIRSRDILYRTGVLWRSVSAIPFNRVQHVETASTPLDRRFRLATLVLYTAGGSGGDLKIHGMPADVAERIRVFLLEQVGGEAEPD